MAGLMTDTQMEDLLEQMKAEDSPDTTAIDVAIKNYPEDPRLHFLKASSCAGAGRNFEAYESFERAVKIAPDFDLARFQFGLFQLTSGEAENALRTLEPLDRLNNDHYLKAFAIGLRHLVLDELPACVEAIQRGQILNRENPTLNMDLQLIVDKLEGLINGDEGVEPTQHEETSVTSMLLQQSGKPTRH